MSEANFDEIAARYDAALPAHVTGHYLRKRVAWISDNCPPGRALDVGCGTGALAQRLSEAGWEVSGIDPSQGMLDVLAERAPGVKARRASGTDLPYPDASFDLTLSVAAMHHIAAPDAVRRTLAEMVRVTVPGGRIVIWDHNPANPYWRSLMARVPQDDGSERLVPAAEIEAGLRSAGAGPIATERLGFVPDFVPERLLGAAAWAERLAERTPLLRRLAAHNVISARRP